MMDTTVYGIIESRKDITASERFKYAFYAATIKFIEQEGGIDKIKIELGKFLTESMEMPSYKKYLKKHSNPA